MGTSQKNWLKTSLKSVKLALAMGCSMAMAQQPQAEVIRFSEDEPWLSDEGEVLNPEVHRIDVSKHKAGPIPDMEPSDWTVAVWNFPAWNPGGKHMPELAYGKPRRLPLLYDPTDPKCLHNGIYYSSLAKPEVMDWHIKWMREANINLVMFDWYPSTSKVSFDNSPRHRTINASIEEGFLGKKTTGGPAVKTNRFEKKIDFLAMWTNHGHAWIPKGTMEYACENFLNQPNYHQIDGKPAIIIHAPGVLMDEHGGTGSRAEKNKKIRDWVKDQRRIAKSYGHDEIYMAVGAIQPQFSKWFKSLGFDGAFTYVTHADKAHETVTPIEYTTKKGHVRKGTLHEADYETDMIPSHKIFWNKMWNVWGDRDYFPTLTVREDWRHWGPQRMLYYHGCTPDVYSKAIDMAKNEIKSGNRRKFLTVGIWNEIYEDGYLQPDVKYGYEYIKRIKIAFK
jgi:hypothetical protein